MQGSGNGPSILRHITAPCSNSLPHRSGKSFAISTTIRSGWKAPARASLRILRRGDTGRRDEQTGTFLVRQMARIAAQHDGQPPRRVPGSPDREAGRAFAARFGLIYPQYLPISGYSADSKIARGLLHSRAAFGIALRVAGE